MIYIDTDVLVHAYVDQDIEKYQQANEVIRRAVSDGAAVVSTLSVQELVFVLAAKLNTADEDMDRVYNAVMQFEPLSYDGPVLRRAFEIAKIVGFRNISDCIHTAVAERHCTELITYNRSDFRRISEVTTIQVTIL